MLYYNIMPRTTKSRSSKKTKKNNKKEIIKVSKKIVTETNKLRKNIEKKTKNLSINEQKKINPLFRKKKKTLKRTRSGSSKNKSNSKLVNISKKIVSEIKKYNNKINSILKKYSNSFKNKIIKQIKSIKAGTADSIKDSTQKKKTKKVTFSDEPPKVEKDPANKTNKEITDKTVKSAIENEGPKEYSNKKVALAALGVGGIGGYYLNEARMFAEESDKEESDKEGCEFADNDEDRNGIIDSKEIEQDGHTYFDADGDGELSEDEMETTYDEDHIYHAYSGDDPICPEDADEDGMADGIAQMLEEHA